MNCHLDMRLHTQIYTFQLVLAVTKIANKLKHEKFTEMFSSSHFKKS